MQLRSEFGPRSSDPLRLPAALGGWQAPPRPAMRRRAAPPRAQGPLRGSGRRPAACGLPSLPLHCRAEPPGDHRAAGGQSALLHWGRRRLLSGSQLVRGTGEGCRYLRRVRDCMSEEAAPYTSKTGLGGPPAPFSLQNLIAGSVLLPTPSLLAELSRSQALQQLLRPPRCGVHM